MTTTNDSLLRALRREKVTRTPVWLMRQAGRYLPEYREVRKKAGNFMTLCKTPELACEVTLQPLARFDLDAAILFSDILTIPDAMGLGLYFSENEGPRFERPLRTMAAIQALRVPDMMSELGYVCDAVKMIRHELAGRVPLIGFSGSPWTLATYMVEGASSKTFSIVKEMLYKEPAMLHQLLQTLSHSVIAYLNAQIASGVQAVMIFDTWGGVLSSKDYEEFSLNYMKNIVDGVNKNTYGEAVPIILFTKGGGLWLEKIADTGCDAVGLDWTVDISDAYHRIGERVALQGNLDPCVLYGTPEKIREEVKIILDAYGNNPGHVFNLGHGIHPQFNPEHIEVLVDAVHSYRGIK